MFVVAEFLGPARAEVSDVIRLISLVCLGGLLLTAAIAFAVAGQILAPVRAVRQAASRITRADLNERITVRGRDEVAALAVTSNAMLDRLQGAFRAHQDFSQAAGKHLRVALDQLEDPATTEAERRATLAEIRETLDDLDVLARSQDPRFVSPVAVDVGALTDQLAEDVGTLADRDWVVQERGQGTAEIDLQRVREAVHSLAANALSQLVPAEAAALLRLGTRVGGDLLEVWVADDGPGLEADLAARVLNRYGEAPPDPHEGSGQTRAGAGRGPRRRRRPPRLRMGGDRTRSRCHVRAVPAGPQPPTLPCPREGADR